MNWHLFFSFIAWPVLIVASLRLSLLLALAFFYEGSDDQKFDRIRGIKRPWPILSTGFITLVSLAWIIAS